MPSRTLSAPDPWRLAWCGDCHLAYITNPPHYEALTAEFEWDQSADAERLRRHAAHSRIGSVNIKVIAWLKRTYRALMRHNKLLALSRRYGLSGEVIDVGCGDGNMWDSLPSGCAPVGIELSPVLVRVARARLKGKPGRLIECDALGGLREIGDSSANGAILISYLEHEANPSAAIRELRRTLRPGAIAILKMPNYACWNRTIRGPRWCGFRFPDHVNYFTPRALRRILARGGFEIVSYGFADHPPTSDNMWCVARVPR
ncbi:MAG TPA: class I SAM-dependent methyltransferase [Opitutaceae bacterium]|nr:class I SAM-dependent methyltransferase [Opitutaceae bacterium]